MAITPTLPLSGFEPARVNMPGPLADDMFASMLGQLFDQDDPAPRAREPDPAPSPQRAERPAARQAERPAPRPDRPAPRPEAPETPAHATAARDDAARSADARSAASRTTASRSTANRSTDDTESATAPADDATGANPDPSAAAQNPSQASDDPARSALGVGTDPATTDVTLGVPGLDESAVGAQSAAEALLAAQAAAEAVGMAGTATDATAGATDAAQALAAQAAAQDAAGTLAGDPSTAAALPTEASAGGAGRPGDLTPGAAGPHDPLEQAGADLAADTAAPTVGEGAEGQAETDFAGLLQAARGALRNGGRSGQDGAGAQPGRDGDGQTSGRDQAGQNAGAANPQALQAATAPVAQGGGGSSATPGIGQSGGLEGSQATLGGERAADAARQTAAGGEGLRPAGNQDFSSHLQGLKTLRGGTPLHQPVTDQVTVQIKRGLGNGSDRMTIQLRPEELGRIEIRLEFGQDGRVAARISAENAQTLELLQKDSRSLERALQEAGLKTDSGSLSFNLRGGDREQQTADQDGRSGGSGHGRGRGPSFEEDINDTLARMPVRTLSLAPGRVDVRI